MVDPQPCIDGDVQIISTTGILSAIEVIKLVGKDAGMVALRDALGEADLIDVHRHMIRAAQRL